MFLFCVSDDANATSKKHISWWIKKYGSIPSDNPYTQRIHDIFSNVLDAADKRGRYYPKLILLNDAEGHLSICIEDGTVIITQQAIDFCYNERKKEIGDAFIAFIIGHELAHLANADFWYHETAETLSSDNKQYTPNEHWLFPTIEPKESRMRREMQADTFGIIYMAMAGFDPKYIIDYDNNDFFEALKKQTQVSITSVYASHPPPGARYTILKSNIQEIIKNINLYYIGIRLYQLEKYRDALIFLEIFNNKYPGKEVYQTLGLIHYQLAMRQLYECNSEKAFRFKLSTILDPYTKADKFKPPKRRYRRIRFENDSCDENLFENATRFFKESLDKDYFYTPVRVNYSSALIMSEQYSEAMAKLMDQVIMNKNDPMALNNLAISIYLLGPNPFIKVDLYKDSTDILRNIINEHPKFQDAYFNLGRIQEERGRHAAAKEVWQEFLKLDDTIIFAEIVMEALNLHETPVSKDYSECFNDAIPIGFGKIGKTMKIKLKDYKRHEYRLGRVFCEFYEKNDTQVIALDDVIEIIERPVNQHITTTGLITRCGKPLKIVYSISGKTTYLYQDFAADIQDNLVIRIIHFEKRLL